MIKTDDRYCQEILRRQLSKNTNALELRQLDDPPEIFICGDFKKLSRVLHARLSSVGPWLQRLTTLRDIFKCHLHCISLHCIVLHLSIIYFHTKHTCISADSYNDGLKMYIYIHGYAYI